MNSKQLSGSVWLLCGMLCSGDALVCSGDGGGGGALSSRGRPPIRSPLY